MTNSRLAVRERTDLPPRFHAAMDAFDRANSADPTQVAVRGRVGPKELLHAELATEWVLRLRNDAPEALLLAARAHHIRRWEVPRSSAPPGRDAYLRWREGLYVFHATAAAEILHRAGYEDEFVERVGVLLRKERIKTDPDAQTLEDALCLVFFETQLDDVAEQIEEARLLLVLRRTWRKMSPRGREAAVDLPLSERGRALIERAVSGA